MRNLVFPFIGLIALIGGGGLALDYHSYKGTQETFQAKVLDKERRCHWVTDYRTVTDSNGNDRQVEDGEHEECTNLVHTDAETLTNDPVVWAGRYNADASQGRLVRGQTYTFKVYGSKNENSGIYRKIIDVGPILPGGGSMGGGGGKNW